nr:MAG TPA: hypothetical protein [Caudoviricetes sp.]
MHIAVHTLRHSQLQWTSQNQEKVLRSGIAFITLLSR